jgi:hypothetical protein
MLNEDGRLAFIQPATAYFNKKNVKRKHRDMMRHNVQKYVTSVQIVSPLVFENAKIISDLSITYLIKSKNNDSKIAAWMTIDGDIYEDVELKHLNKASMQPSLYASILSKIETYIKSNGSISNLITKKENEGKFRLSFIRGNRGTNDMYTFVSRDRSYYDKVDYEWKYGIKISNEDERSSVESYLKTYIARYCLSLIKIDQHMDSSEMELTPIVPFDREWSDAELINLFGITDEEYNAIRSVIPQYYDDVA